jgi:hypothetical protein
VKRKKRKKLAAFRLGRYVRNLTCKPSIAKLIYGIEWTPIIAFYGDGKRELV